MTQRAWIGQEEPVVRILIADDHLVVRSGLRAILESQDGWKVVAEAKDGHEAVTKAIETNPDVAILDYSLPVMNGVEATRQICAQTPGVEVMIFTMHDREALVREVLAAGAHAYLLKSDAKRNLIAAVQSLARHKPFLTDKISNALLGTPRPPHEQTSEKELPLSPRERLIIQLIAEGHSNREIGEILSLNVKTIEAHRSAAMRKLCLTSTAAIVRYAIRNGFVEP